ncbi:hypothetical protein AB0C34_15380 [Nocardia sp. NPDC049220]|uniref:hypothetical protein n=1 Tax=Nocardia sp. NPDC049220 TaxID=3155273 RepID=UPI0033F7DD7B
MTQPTPWHVNDARSRRNQGSDRPTLSATPLGVDRRADWGYLAAAAGSVITFILLFQPWLSASGSDGEVSTDAFGRVDEVASSFDEWTASRDTNISSVWGFLASVALLTTVCAVMAHHRMRTAGLSRLIMASSTAAAILILITMVYLDAKGAELRSLINQPKDHGSLLDKFFGESTTSDADTRHAASAGLTPAAMVGVVAAFATAVVTLAQGIRRYADNLLGRVPVPQPTTTQPAVAVAVDEPRTDQMPPKWDELVFDDDVVAVLTLVQDPSAVPLHEASDHRSRIPILIG